MDKIKFYIYAVGTPTNMGYMTFNEERRKDKINEVISTSNKFNKFKLN